MAIKGEIDRNTAIVRQDSKKLGKFLGKWMGKLRKEKK